MRGCAPPRPQVSEGEKDPRNLLVIFTSLSSMLDTLDMDHLHEDVFEALAVYFPIDFTPPRGLEGAVTKQELVVGLRRALAHPALMQYSVGLLLEKLESDLESAKLDSLETLEEVARRSRSSELEHWGREVEGVWVALHRETLGLRLQPSVKVQEAARTAVRAVSVCLGLGGGALGVGWGRWLERLWGDTRPHLALPSTRLCGAAGEILGEVARAGEVQGREVLRRALPALLEAWVGLEGGKAESAALLVVLGELLVAASEGGVVCGGEGEGVGEALDTSVALLLSTVESGGEVGVGAGVRLGRAAPLLSEGQRQELGRALVAGVGRGEAGLGEGVAELARHDLGLVRGVVVPALLALGHQCIGAVARLWRVGLYWDTAPALVSTLVAGQLGEEGASHLVALLAEHSPGEGVGAASLLVQILEWEARPGGEVMDQVMGKFGALLTQGDCGEVGKVLERRRGAVGAVLLSVRAEVQAAWAGLVSTTMGEGAGEEVWRVRAALVNRDPSLAPALASVGGQGVAWLAAGLARRGDGSAGPWLEALVKKVAEGEQGAVEGVGRLLEPCWWHHPVTGLLFKQRVWAQLHPALSTPQGGPGHLAAMVLLLPSLPRALLEPKLPALLPLVVRALSSPGTAMHALSCLRDFIKLDVSVPLLTMPYDTYGGAHGGEPRLYCPRQK